MEKLEDREIIIKIKSGKIDYYTYIVNKYTQRVYNYLYKKIFNKDDIDDIVQLIFLKFYKAINNFDEERPILPYLFEIIKNEIKMYYRSRDKAMPLREEIISTNQFDFSYEALDVEQLLKLLSSEERTALNLLSEGYLYHEIASKLDKPLNTVKTLIRRARLKVIKISKEQNGKT